MPSAVAERATTPPQGANNDYVGSHVCAGCHAEVYRSYRETDMGRSMALASEAYRCVSVAFQIMVRIRFTKTFVRSRG